MKIIDMARTAKEKKAAEERYKVSPSTGEDYPYGLTLNLGKDELEKLGIDDLPAVGDEKYFYVACKVTRVHALASENYESIGVEMQITKMALEEPPKEEEKESKREDGNQDFKAAAKTLYGKK